MEFAGKIPRDFENMRTEFAWFCKLDAMHIPISHLMNDNTTDNDYDLGIVIIPKNLMYMDSIVTKMKAICKKTAFMQEGPSWYFQSLPLKESMWLLNEMLAVDVVFAHNNVDAHYYEGLLDKQTYINPTLMITDSIKDLPTVERSGIILGGNFGDWYSGVNSYMVATEFEDEITLPQMGRMDKDELQLADVKHLPYSNWKGWMGQLNNFKYAVHMNKHTIGGTFSLNCAYLGIPCIGNLHSNTQRICFPELSFEPWDLKAARVAAKKLQTDTELYNKVSKQAKDNYEEFFSEKSYQIAWDGIKYELK